MWGRANLRIIQITALYVAAAYYLGAHYGFAIDPWPRYQLRIFSASAAFGVGLFFFWRLWIERPPSPFKFLPVFWARYRVGARLIATLPVLIAVGFMLSTFGSIKSGIPAMQPFSYDPMFADWDEMIHGGPAWKLMHPVVGFPLVTFLINLAYNAWFVVFYSSIVYVSAWIERPGLRERYLVSFILCWILIGSVAAVFTSSVGPCFYYWFYDSQRFSPLMTYLAATNTQYPLDALKVQAILLDWHRLGAPGLGKGISAMPSMHVSIAALMALFCWKVSKRWGIIASAYATIIFVGSIHLGYHYAIDGYAALVLTGLIWAAAGVKFRMPHFRRVEIA